MKLSRMFSIIFKNKEFDIEFSKVIETSKAKGHIALSIDPIDFVLMSINKSGWNSCHSLSQEFKAKTWGCYSSGIFSYMCDEATIITYKHNGTEYDYVIGKNKFKAFSKNWRELIYFDNNTNGFIASRQYPYYDENLSFIVRKMFEEILSNKKGFENKFSKITNGGRNNVKDNTELHYNDVLHGYDHIFCYPSKSDKSEVDIQVGSEPICPICGKNLITQENIPMCTDCYEEEV